MTLHGAAMAGWRPEIDIVPACGTMNNMGHAAQDYQPHLEGLPFVEKATLKGGEVRLETPRGMRRLRGNLVSTSLSYPLIEGVLRRAGKKPWILLARHVSRPMGEHLRSLDVNYCDLAGNLHVRLGAGYVAVIEGRSAARPVAPAGLTHNDYRVLFALLVDEDLLAASVRVLSEAAGVSKSSISRCLERLEAKRMLVRGEPGSVRSQRDELIDQFVHGYVATLRPRLLIGTYRPAENPKVLDKKLAKRLGALKVGWGGDAGAYRLVEHYRSPRTTIHLEADPGDLPTRLKALPSPDGFLEVLGIPGPLAIGGGYELAHPILIYAELLATGDPRSREQAALLLAEHVNV